MLIGMALEATDPVLRVLAVRPPWPSTTRTASDWQRMERPRRAMLLTLLGGACAGLVMAVEAVVSSLLSQWQATSSNGFCTRMRVRRQGGKSEWSQEESGVRCGIIDRWVEGFVHRACRGIISGWVCIRY